MFIEVMTYINENVQIQSLINTRFIVEIIHDNLPPKFKTKIKFHDDSCHYVADSYDELMAKLIKARALND